MDAREFYDEEPVQTNSYTCTITRMTRDSGSGWECRSEGERDGRNTRKKTRVPQREGGRWTSGKSERRATYRGGGTEDNKCQNNDLPVAGRADCQPSWSKSSSRCPREFEIDESCFHKDWHVVSLINKICNVTEKTHHWMEIFIPNLLQKLTWKLNWEFCYFSLYV